MALLSQMRWAQGAMHVLMSELGITEDDHVSLIDPRWKEVHDGAVASTREVRTMPPWALHSVIDVTIPSSCCCLRGVPLQMLSTVAVTSAARRRALKLFTIAPAALACTGIAVCVYILVIVYMLVSGGVPVNMSSKWFAFAYPLLTLARGVLAYAESTFAANPLNVLRSLPELVALGPVHAVGVLAAVSVRRPLLLRVSVHFATPLHASVHVLVCTGRFVVAHLQDVLLKGKRHPNCKSSAWQVVPSPARCQDGHKAPPLPLTKIEAFVWALSGILLTSMVTAVVRFIQVAAVSAAWDPILGALTVRAGNASCRMLSVLPALMSCACACDIPVGCILSVFLLNCNTSVVVRSYYEHQHRPQAILTDDDVSTFLGTLSLVFITCWWSRLAVQNVTV